MNSVKWEISWGSLWRALTMIALVGLVYYLRDVVVTVLLSIFISAALGGVVLKFEKLRIPRILAAIIVFLLAIFILAFVVYTIIPIGIIELNALLNNLSGTAGGVFGADTASNIKNLINPDLNHLANLLLAGNASFIDIVGRLLGGAAYFLSVLVISFYLTVSRDGVISFLRSIFPGAIEDRAIQIYQNTVHKISRWFNTQLLLILIVGFLVFVGLTLFGVKYSLILAVVAGLFELVPVVGPIFAGALSVIVASAQSLSLGIYVLIMFLVIQQTESNVLVPLMLRRAIQIHPVVILIAILAGTKLMGPAGLVLAIPSAVFFEEMLHDWVEKKSKSPSAA